MRTKRKICGCILSAALVASSAGVLYACGDKPQLNENFEGRTVCYEIGRASCRERVYVLV